MTWYHIIQPPSFPHVLFSKWKNVCLFACILALWPSFWTVVVFQSLSLVLLGHYVVNIHAEWINCLFETWRQIFLKIWLDVNYTHEWNQSPEHYFWETHPLVFSCPDHAQHLSLDVPCWTRRVAALTDRFGGILEAVIFMLHWIRVDQTSHFIPKWSFAEHEWRWPGQFTFQFILQMGCCFLQKWEQGFFSKHDNSIKTFPKNAVMHCLVKLLGKNIHKHVHSLPSVLFCRILMHHYLSSANIWKFWACLHTDKCKISFIN